MKIILASAIALALAAPAAAEVFNGPFVGIQAGWNREKVSSVDSKVGALTINESKDAFVGGVFAGYDRQVSSRIVLGAEGGFNLTTSDELTRTGRDYSGTINPTHGFDLTARAGYLVDPQTLIYVRGGYDNLRANVRLVNNSVVTSGHDTFDGWLVGGGIERAIGSRISARVEYRYSDLSSGNSSFDRHEALVGIAYHF